jgi:hypothetical protein
MIDVGFTFTLLLVYDIFSGLVRGPSADKQVFMLLCDMKQRHAAFVFLLFSFIVCKTSMSDFVFYAAIPLVEIVA